MGTGRGKRTTTAQKQRLLCCYLSMILFPNEKFENNTFDLSRFARRRYGGSRKTWHIITSDLSVRK
jgi:hypothetical protein